MTRRHPTYPRLLLPVSMASLLGCGGPSAPSPSTIGAVPVHAPPGDIPAAITIPATTMTYGFALNVARTSVAVGAFTISKRPTTVHEYDQCVQAGACSVPSAKTGPCSASSGADGATYTKALEAADLAVTCATPSQATQYCNWVGGRLPYATEWMLAARGPDVHRFAWGDSNPTCAQRSRISFFADFPDPCCGSQCSSPTLAKVAQHDSITSPLGLTDVLLTRGEMLGAADPSNLGCGAGTEGCAVFGIAPGAIDGLAPVAPSTATAVPATGAAPVSAFRCVWTGGAG